MMRRSSSRSSVILLLLGLPTSHGFHIVGINNNNNNIPTARQLTHLEMTKEDWPAMAVSGLVVGSMLVFSPPALATGKRHYMHTSFHRLLIHTHT
jgi:hypothetical protein